VYCCSEAMCGGMRERKRTSYSDNRRGLVTSSSFSRAATDEGKRPATRHVAFENGIAHVPAPHCRPWLSPSSEVAPAHDRPPRVACKHPSGRFNLVVEVHNASEAREPTHDVHEHFDLPRVDRPGRRE